MPISNGSHAPSSVASVSLHRGRFTPFLTTVQTNTLSLVIGSNGGGNVPFRTGGRLLAK